MTTFGIVRHGQTDWNLHKRIQGSTDIPLNDDGRRQAIETGASLRDGHWDAIVASPLSRASETALIIAHELGLPEPELIPDLAERRHGEIEGLSDAERALRFPDDASVPGLETRQEVLDRVLPVLERVAGRHPGGRVLIVSHGGVISALVRHATDGDLETGGRMIANGSVQRFRWGAGGLHLIECRLDADEDTVATG
ncbi:histidine phosphatase family protein [Luethyella okanaganae]|uniref:Histidine phosphatase family protein n=1 Tax=Luethyella okanaganae TaxID=69372 RepID=A0ABW1VFU6_9MICO